MLDIASILSPPTFVDDNLTEQFYSDIGATSSLLEPHRNDEDDLSVSLIYGKYFKAFQNFLNIFLIRVKGPKVINLTFLKWSI